MDDFEDLNLLASPFQKISCPDCSYSLILGFRYETRSDYRLREELRREVVREREALRARDHHDQGDGGRRGRDEYSSSQSHNHGDRERGDRDRHQMKGSGSYLLMREGERRERRDVSKKARDREKRYGTDGYKSRKRSSTRFGYIFDPILP